MRYLSVCSGIEAASIAWNQLGWNAEAYAEIEKFPSAVLEYHYPNVPNLGDMNEYEKWSIERPDILVGGTPCQSFSVAGLRKGLRDPRGGLMLTYLEIAKHFESEWVVWENVPGVLSSNGGRDFGSFLGALGELGYGWAYRVLDAQWFGVAQRRRRVFVVGCFGDQRSAAKVLFESESVRRDNPPSRDKRKGATSFTPSSIAGYSEGVGTIRANGGDLGGGSETLVMAHGQPNAEILSGLSPTLNCNHEQPIIVHGTQDPCVSDIAFAQGRNNGGENVVFQAIPINTMTVFENHPNDSRVKEMGDVCSTVASRWESGGGNVPFCLHGTQGPCTSDIAFAQGRIGCGIGNPGDPAPTLLKGHHHAVAFEPGISSREGGNNRFVSELTPTLRKEMGDNQIAVAYETTNAKAFQQNTRDEVRYIGGDGDHVGAMQVRRLTPTECERLQGFPDGYTNIPWRGKQESPDGPRYKALGNSMAAPVMRWIGERINAIPK